MIRPPSETSSSASASAITCEPPAGKPQPAVRVHREEQAGPGRRERGHAAGGMRPTPVKSAGATSPEKRASTRPCPARGAGPESHRGDGIARNLQQLRSRERDDAPLSGEQRGDQPTPPGRRRRARRPCGRGRATRCRAAAVERVRVRDLGTIHSMRSRSPSLRNTGDASAAGMHRRARRAEPRSVNPAERTPPPIDEAASNSAPRGRHARRNRRDEPFGPLPTTVTSKTSVTLRTRLPWCSCRSTAGGPSRAGAGCPRRRDPRRPRRGGSPAVPARPRTRRPPAR